MFVYVANSEALIIAFLKMFGNTPVQKDFNPSYL